MSPASDPSQESDVDLFPMRPFDYGCLAVILATAVLVTVTLAQWFGWL